jgi:hypothetical protein
VDVEENGKDNHIALLKSEEMGAILGVTPESVSRVTAEFKREGILAPVPDSDTELYSPDLDALASIAAEE